MHNNIISYYMYTVCCLQVPNVLTQLNCVDMRELNFEKNHECNLQCCLIAVIFVVHWSFIHSYIFCSQETYIKFCSLNQSLVVIH